MSATAAADISGLKQRRSERIRTMLGAQIVFNNGMASVSCQVRNMSETGARISLSNTMALPQEFDLTIPAKGRTLRAALRWRSDDAVGVEFLTRDAPASASREDAELNRLEAENARLRAQLRDLLARFERAGVPLED